VLAPGAHAAIELDIMSQTPGLVGAETFAAVKPANNSKLRTDLLKLAARTEQYRYIFFISLCVSRVSGGSHNSRTLAFRCGR